MHFSRFNSQKWQKMSKSTEKSHYIHSFLKYNPPTSFGTASLGDKPLSSFFDILTVTFLSATQVSGLSTLRYVSLLSVLRDRYPYFCSGCFARSFSRALRAAARTEAVSEPLAPPRSLENNFVYSKIVHSAKADWITVPRKWRKFLQF